MKDVTSCLRRAEAEYKQGFAVTLGFSVERVGNFPTEQSFIGKCQFGKPEISHKRESGLMNFHRTTVRGLTAYLAGSGEAPVWSALGMGTPSFEDLELPGSSVTYSVWN